MDDIYYAVAHRSQAEIDAFKTRYDSFDVSIIPRLFRDSLSLTVRNYHRPTSWGSSHVIYYVTVEERDQPLVLRANTGFNPQPEYVMKVEQLITDQVRAIGVPTNHILYVDISRTQYPFDFQIEACLTGDDLEDHFSGTQVDYDRLSYRLGEYVAAIHTIHVPKFGRFDATAAQKGELRGTKETFYDYIVTCLDSDLRYLQEAGVIKPKVKKAIVSLFAEREAMINRTEGVLVHHDLADHNIMSDGRDITGIFDWEAAVVGDPLLDIASCPTWKTHYPREAQFISGYTAHAMLPEDFRERLDIYRLRTMLWKVVYAIRAGILDAARKDRFATALAPFRLSII